MPFSTYLPEQMGSIKLTPSGPFVAGSHAELTLTYTAGTFGIDDTGMVKISWRTTSSPPSSTSRVSPRLPIEPSGACPILSCARFERETSRMKWLG